MRAEVVVDGELQKHTALDVKRLYLPGVRIQAECTCGEQIVEDLAEHYLGYPDVHVPFDHTLYCAKCEVEHAVRLVLRVSLEVVE